MMNTLIIVPEYHLIDNSYFIQLRKEKDAVILKQGSTPHINATNENTSYLIKKDSKIISLFFVETIDYINSKKESVK